jgi:flagellar protein FliO/FliZ
MKPLTYIRGAALAGAVALLHAPIALAATPADAFEKTRLHLGHSVVGHAAPSAGIGGSLVRTIVGLAIVIAVIYGLTWIMRQARAAKNPAKGTEIEQIASLPLGSNKSVALVRVGTELHLLGVAEQNVTSIRTFSEDEAVDFGLPVSAPGEEPSASSRSASRSPSTPTLLRAVDAVRRMTVR